MTEVIASGVRSLNGTILSSAVATVVVDSGVWGRGNLSNTIAIVAISLRGWVRSSSSCSEEGCDCEFHCVYL